MADLDPEMVDRVIRWCAEAGRQTSPAEVRAALSQLRWDDLLNVRALLVDPPPARPLGPGALADLARGTPADVAAEREREGRYLPELEEQAEPPASEPSPAPSARAGRPRKGTRRPTAPLIHRKRDQIVPAAPTPPSKPALERLLDPPGRAVLERLIRDHGARRAFLLGELARWGRADGGTPTDGDLDALLDHHGLARAFAHRERDELLHALRAARGDRRAAASKVGLEPEAFQAALDRLAARDDAERIREDRRADLRARATLADRCRQLATEAERLEDLGLLAEVETDLRARLGEHLRALRAASPGALSVAFARSVSLEERDALALAARLGIELPSSGGAAANPARSAPPRRPGGERGPTSRSSGGPSRGKPFPGRPARGGARDTGGQRGAGRWPARAGRSGQERDRGGAGGPAPGKRGPGRGGAPRSSAGGPSRGGGPRSANRGPARGAGRPSGRTGPRRPGGRGPRPAR
jgi:hypothetical protein